MKQVFGTSLLCEPVDGSVDPIERAAETQRLRERVADLEAQLAKKK
jgi:hypothetical protein